MANPNQQKQEVVFGKSSATQKTSPTGPHGSNLQSNNSGATVQHGQVKKKNFLLLAVKGVLYKRLRNIFFLMPP